MNPAAELSSKGFHKKCMISEIIATPQIRPLKISL